MSYIINNELVDSFSVLDSTNNFVIGIDSTTFSTYLFDPDDIEVSSFIQISISELGYGHYRISFIPNKIGNWYMVILHNEYFPTGKAGSYYVENEIEITDSTTIINIDSKIDDLIVKCNNNSEELKRILGLVHENIFIDLPTYDDDNNLIGARIRIYSDSSSVGTTNNIIGTYNIESNGSGQGKFSSWKQVKI